MLVVDDSVAVRTRVVALLEEVGLVVVGEAANAAEGLRFACALRPQAIVLDLHLPDGSGLEILPALKALEPPPIVAILTNAAHPAARTRSHALGADYFFDKSSEFHRVAAALMGHGR